MAVVCQQVSSIWVSLMIFKINSNDIDQIKKGHFFSSKFELLFFSSNFNWIFCKIFFFMTYFWVNKEKKYFYHELKRGPNFEILPNSKLYTIFIFHLILWDFFSYTFELIVTWVSGKYTFQQISSINYSIQLKFDSSKLMLESNLW